VRPLGELPPEANELMSCLRDEKVELQEVQEILRDCPIAVNAREETFGWSPLLFAAHRGDTKLLTLLLDSKADVRCTCHHGNNALHLAARGGHINAATLLHAKGTECEARNMHGWTALMWAAIAGCQAVAAVLIDNAADVNAEDEAGRTPCMWAARHGHTGILRNLIGMGVDLSTCDNDGLTLEDHARAFEALQASLGMASRTQHGWRSSGEGGALYWATEQGSLDLTKLYSQHGATTEQTQTGWTSDLEQHEQQQPLEVVTEAMSASQRLLAAAKANRWDDAEAALRAGACAATRGEIDRLSALDWAALHDASAAAMTLVVAKARLEGRDELGWTALHHAVHAGSVETTSVLHHLGSDFAAQSDEGDTVQHLAARADAGVMLQLLHAATPNWEQRDSEGFTPIQAAASRGCLSSLRVLLTLHADVNSTDRQGRSAFALAVAQGHATVVRAFLEPAQPLEQLWQEEELQTILQGLPWVADEAVGSRRTSSASTSGASGVSSASGALSSASGASGATHDRKGRRGRKRSSIKMAMHTIAEVDSDAESLSVSPSPRGRSHSRPSSAGSRASDASNGTLRSAARSRTSAQSRQSSRSRLSDQSGSVTSSHQDMSGGRRGRSSVSSRASSQGRVSKSGSHASSSSKVGSTSSRRTGGSKASRAGAQGWTGTRISSSPVGLMWSACMASKKPELLPSPVPIAGTLRATDNEGRAALALAAHFGHAELLAELLRLKAPVDATDNRGWSALMIAAARGDRLSVGHLLSAGANDDLRSCDGYRAVDHASTADVRRELQEHADRNAINRHMSKSCSLPSLVKTPAAEPKGKPKAQPLLKFRLRLDCLPMGLPGEHVESEVWDLLDTHGVLEAIDVDVAVDPITLRSRGHAFIEFGNAKEAEAGDARLRARLGSESFLRISMEAPIAA